MTPDQLAKASPFTKAPESKEAADPSLRLLYGFIRGIDWGKVGDLPDTPNLPAVAKDWLGRMPGNAQAAEATRSSVEATVALPESEGLASAASDRVKAEHFRWLLSLAGRGLLADSPLGGELLALSDFAGSRGIQPCTLSPAEDDQLASLDAADLEGQKRRLESFADPKILEEEIASIQKKVDRARELERLIEGGRWPTKQDEYEHELAQLQRTTFGFKGILTLDEALSELEGFRRDRVRQSGLNEIYQDIEIRKELRRRSKKEAESEKAFVDSVKGSPDLLLNPMLRLYRQEYSNLPEDIRARASWEDILFRLLDGEFKGLKLANAMQGGGQLFGIDRNGKALFKDRGVEPVMYGFDSEGGLMRIYDRDPEKMAAIETWANYNVIRSQAHKEGYELFPFDPANSDRFSDEMTQVQAHTKEPFVASQNRREWRFSWLESDDSPEYARCARFDPGSFGASPGGARVVLDYSGEQGSGRGAMRLLRV